MGIIQRMSNEHLLLKYYCRLARASVILVDSSTSMSREIPARRFPEGSSIGGRPRSIFELSGTLLVNTLAGSTEFAGTGSFVHERDLEVPSLVLSTAASVDSPAHDDSHI